MYCRLAVQWLFLLPFLLNAAPPQDALSRRQSALEATLRILRPTSSTITGRINAIDKTWEDWVRRTRELPPDFDAMPSIPKLPDPFTMYEDGERIRVNSLPLWNKQRAWIRSQFEHWVFGSMPPPPGNLRATVTATRREGQVTIQDVRLDFGPERRGRLRLQLIIPPGAGQFPVFLTNHPRIRPWVNVAVRRGYLACIYFAADPRVTLETDDADGLIELYPDYDFACLGRWAWMAMRAVDYLLSRPDVDKGRIALTGHSRGGKQALLAAAFDERIGAVLPLSGNTGEGTPWRYTTDMFVNESIEQITGSFPHWFHPRLRFFAGREHKLPVDQNLLAALVAPRALLLNSAYAESQGNPWGFEQTYRSAREVYRFLGSEDKIGLYLRAGEHMPSAEDIEVFLDFFDRSFGRKQFPKLETFVHGYTFEGWKKTAGADVDPLSFPKRRTGDFLTEGGKEAWNEEKAAIRRRIVWALGEEPAGIGIVPNRKPGGPTVTTDSWIADIYKRPLKSPGMRSVQIPFGDELIADLYYSDASDGASPRKWPVVLWLHPYAYATGYSRYARSSFESLVKRGFAVMAFDQIGFGTRVFSAGSFYERYPKWSLMGKMVSDTRAAIDALSALDLIDSSRVVLFGYALGAKVGLLTAALDDRIRAVVAVCGFSPFRLEGASTGTEGLRHYSHLHGLIPRLGFFLGNEDRVPFDYDEVIAAIAPRAVRVVAPELDRYAPVANVRRAVEAAAAVYRLYGRPEALTLDTPFDFNRLSRDTEAHALDWLAHIQ